MNLVKFLLFLFICQTSAAQINLPIPRNIAASYAKGTRSKSGSPGPVYWQNSADYNIAVSFNPATLLVKGEETVTYTNNSPDTLQEVLLKIYPNFYKKGSLTLWKISPDDLGEGMQIETVNINGTETIIYTIEGTNMAVKIPALLPAGKLSLKLAFHYTLNKGSHNRTGQVEPDAAFIAYFFPRITVYDDVDGWNKYPYIGTQEFYNDFCKYKVAITVPKGFVVWATGDLKNAKDVLQPHICQRLQLAEITNTPLFVIDSSDLLKNNVTTSNAQNTWLFEAENVTDFVFATSNHYLWESVSLIVDSATNRRTRCDAAFNATHHDYKEVLGYNYKTVKSMSFVFPKWPFPYSHITIFDGLDQMEYPMMVNDNPMEKFDAITTTDHEVFHTMFPFYMGINETKYGWMDEGWATIGEWLISPMIDSTMADDYGMRKYDSAAGLEDDLPIMTVSTQLNGNAFFMNSYVKPGLGYLYVKDYLGDELFTKALHHYIATWQGKHPMPFDFFNCMNTGSGKDLNWFWKQWFFENGHPDLAISKVKRSGKKFTVTIENKGLKSVPVDLLVLQKNGTVIRLHKSIGVWEKGEKTTRVSFKTSQHVTRIVLGGLYNTDTNKADNVWINSEPDL